MEEKKFLSILLVYSAHVDYEFSPSEKDFISHLVSEDDFNYAMDLMNSRSQSEVFNLINDNILEIYTSKEKQDNLLELLLQLFYCDGEYSNFEQSFMNYLKMIFESDFQVEVSSMTKSS